MGTTSQLRNTSTFRLLLVAPGYTGTLYSLREKAGRTGNPGFLKRDPLCVRNANRDYDGP